MVLRQFFLGIGLSRQQKDEINIGTYIISCLQHIGISQIEGVATRADRVDHPLILHLAMIFSANIVAFSIFELEAQTLRLANPSPRLYTRIGCHGVAEAAALASAGVAGTLVIEKTIYQTMSFAVAQTSTRKVVQGCVNE